MWNGFANLGFSYPKVKLQNTQNLVKREEPFEDIKEFKKQKKQRSKKKKLEDDEYYVKRRQQQSTLVRWSKQEDLNYINFLKCNQKYFSCQNLRRTSKVFMHLSLIMGSTRTPNQCKSHHQKMQKATKNGTVQEIVEYLQQKHSLVVEKQILEQKVQTKDQIKTSLQQMTNHDAYSIKLGTRQQQLQITIIINLQKITSW